MTDVRWSITLTASSRVDIELINLNAATAYEMLGRLEYLKKFILDQIAPASIINKAS